MQVTVPFLGANDDTCIISRWHKNSGQHIAIGDLICTLETTKTNIDVESNFDGVLHVLVGERVEVKVGQVIGGIGQDGGDVAQLVLDKNDSIDRKITAKAKKLLIANNLESSNITSATSIITEADVITHLALTNPLEESIDIQEEFSRLKFSEKSVLLIGAGHGNRAAAQYIDNFTEYRPCAFISYAGGNAKEALSGLATFPDIYLEKFYNAGCRNVFMHLPFAHLDEFYEKLVSLGFNFISFIHPSAVICESTAMGKSVFILENAVIGPNAVIKDFAYIGPCAIVGSNVEIGRGSMVLNAASVAHDSEIGDGCVISDGARVAGRVKVGGKTLVGLGATINSNISIGVNCVINSGANAYSDIADGTTLKNDNSRLKNYI